MFETEVPIESFVPTEDPFWGTESGSASEEYVPQEFAPQGIEELEIAAQEGLTPADMVGLQEQEAGLAELPPLAAEQLQQEEISMENETAAYSEQVGEESAEAFDQTLIEE